MSALRSPRSSSPSASPYTPSDRVKLEVTILDAETTTPSAPDAPAPGASKRPPGAGPAAVIVLLLLLGAAFPGVSRAQIVVTSTNDSGPGSLRQAVADAAQGETITFDAALNGRTLVLTGGQMVLDKNLTIDATNLPDGFTIDASGASRHFVIHRDGQVTLEGLTLAGGYDTGNGGSIAVDGALWLVQSTLTDNRADLNGGAVWSQGTLFVVNSTIRNSTAGASGGGIYNQGDNLSVRRSTVHGNTAAYGGGIRTNGGTFVTVNSTISGNAAAGGNGGGLFVGSGALAGFYGTTLYANTSTSNTSQLLVSGGTVQLVGTVAGGGSSTYACATEYGGTAVLEHTLVEDGSCGAPRSGDPMLGPLQDNGGPTPTHLPLAGSPLIDAGTCALDVFVASDATLDQRGFERQVDWPDVENAGGSACDIGAVERTVVEEEEPPVLWFVVDTVEDPGDGSCEDGDCALRDAIAAASHGATITFDATLSGATITLGGTEIRLDKDLTIDATELPGGLTLDANSASRHFWVDRKRVVTLKGLTLVNGREQEDGRGGAIHNQGGTLTLEDCTLANNSAIEGGAIYSMMSLDIYWDPELGGPAGEGWILGHLTIRRSTLVGNVATEEGGAIYSSTGMTLVGSTIYDNVAGEDGGGLYNDPLNETLGQASYISHTTISGNTAHGVGGGIAHIATKVHLFIDNSTIAENAAYGSYGEYDGGDAMTADAIFTAVTGDNSFTSSRVTVTSSVVSGVAETPAPDCYHHPFGWQFGTNVIVLHHSLDASGNCNYNDIGEGNLTGDPMLGPLQDNGGPTLTHLPLPGSPLIDAGVCDGDTDQRGYARSVDVPGYANSTSACDIGAVEATAEDVPLPTLTTYVVDTAEGAYDGDFSAGDRSLREVIALAPSGTTITFAPSLRGAIIDLSGPAITLDKDLTIDGGDLGVTLDAAGTPTGGDRHFVVADGASVTLRGLTLKNGHRSYVFFRADDSSGGSIFNQGTLLVEACTFEGNHAAGNGGAIWNTGTLTVRQSTFIDNSAGEEETLRFDGDGDGGAILNAGALTIAQSTFSGNTAFGFGGALRTQSLTTITSSTFVGNTADAEASGVGTGDVLYSTTADVSLRSTVMAGTSSLADCASTESFAQNTSSFIADGSCDAAYSGDPMLGLLQDNGGPTLTHLPLVGSPLIDAGVCDGDTDQRGKPRPVDDPDAAGAGCDIGAVELQIDDPRLDLPVELTAFTAVRDGGTVRLAWQTAGEVNNAGFHVEHRSAGASDAAWQELGFVEGAGTTLEARRYVFDTDVLTPGRYAFRLRQVDTDGAFSYSPEVELIVGVEGEAHLSSATPNPFVTQTRFRLAVSQPQVVRIVAYDALGREVARLWEGSLEADRTMEVVWEAGSLPSGVYFVRVEGEQFVRTRRVMLVR